MFRVGAGTARRIRPSKRTLATTQQNTSALAPSSAASKDFRKGSIHRRCGFGGAEGGYRGIFEGQLNVSNNGSSSDPYRLVVHPRPTMSSSTTSSFRVFMPYRFRIPDEGYHVAGGDTNSPADDVFSSPEPAMPTPSTTASGEPKIHTEDAAEVPNDRLARFYGRRRDRHTAITVDDRNHNEVSLTRRHSAPSFGPHQRDTLQAITPKQQSSAPTAEGYTDNGSLHVSPIFSLSGHGASNTAPAVSESEVQRSSPRLTERAATSVACQVTPTIPDIPDELRLDRAACEGGSQRGAAFDRVSRVAVGKASTAALRRVLSANGEHPPTFEVRAVDASPMRVRLVPEEHRQWLTSEAQHSSRVGSPRTTTPGGGPRASVLVAYITDLESEREDLLCQLEQAESARNRALSRQEVLEREVDIANLELRAASLERLSQKRSLIPTPTPRRDVLPLKKQSGGELPTIHYHGEDHVRRTVSVGTDSPPHSDTDKAKQICTPRAQNHAVQAEPQRSSTAVQTSFGDKNDAVKATSERRRRFDKSHRVPQISKHHGAAPQSHAGAASAVGDRSEPALTSAVEMTNPQTLKQDVTRSKRVLISPMPSASDEVIKYVSRLQEDVRRIGNKIDFTEALVAHSLGQAGSVSNSSFQSNAFHINHNMGGPGASVVDHTMPGPHHHLPSAAGHRSVSAHSAISDHGINVSTRGSPSDFFLSHVPASAAVEADHWMAGGPSIGAQSSLWEQQINNSSMSPPTRMVDGLVPSNYQRSTSVLTDGSHAAWFPHGASTSTGWRHSLVSGHTRMSSSSATMGGYAITQPQNHRRHPLISPFRDMEGGVTYLSSSTTTAYPSDSRRFVDQQFNTTWDHVSPLVRTSWVDGGEGGRLDDSASGMGSRTAIFSASLGRDVGRSLLISPNDAAVELPTNLERLAQQGSPVAPQQRRDDAASPVADGAPSHTVPSISPPSSDGSSRRPNPSPPHHQEMFAAQLQLSPPPTYHHANYAAASMESGQRSPRSRSVGSSRKAQHHHHFDGGNNSMPSVSPPTLSQYMDEQWSPQRDANRRRVALEDLRFSLDTEDEVEVGDGGSLSPQPRPTSDIVVPSLRFGVVLPDEMHVA